MPSTSLRRGSARARRRIRLITDPRAAAKAANLVYIADDTPGITRTRAGRGWTYTAPDGTRIRDRATLQRIRSLAIPPAYTDVWISPDPDGHIQATGRDEKGRKQYRYHPRWAQQREETKFARMLLFAQALPRMRARVEADLRRRGLPREKVLATVVALLGSTYIRVGNAEYARDNDSYGLTTLQDEHVQATPSALRFRFRGKSGKEHAVDLRDKRLARIVRQCQDLPGQHLFQYIGEDGQPHSITSSDVNAYIRAISSDEADADVAFTAKDFRTWGGTTLAVLACAEMGTCEGLSQRDRKRRLASMIRSVAEQLGNTQAVCKKYYVHPAIAETYAGGTLLALFEQECARGESGDPYGLSPVERTVERVLSAL
jgi:DNA topoisomerase-1